MALSPELENLLRECWWGAIASVTRLTGGDIAAAEDAVQDACLVAAREWPSGAPRNPGAWLAGVARHKAVDRMRRESRRPGKEESFARSAGQHVPAATVDDELRLAALCCHPALSAEARVALALRLVAGLTTSEIAAAFLVPEATMVKRIQRAKTKIREAGLSLTAETHEDLRQRAGDILKVVYLIFAEGHRASSGPQLVRADLCVAAVNLARGLRARRPDEPEVVGLLALLLLTDARRPARVDSDGVPVLLEEQDRSRWDGALIEEGEELLVQALRKRRPGPYQLWAAIAACHSTARSADLTDWRQISVLYGELLRYEPSPVIEANRAIAVAMAEGPAAGLTILDVLLADPRLSRWPSLHIGRADLLTRMGRRTEAEAAYRRALELEPPTAERRFVERRLSGGSVPLER